MQTIVQDMPIAVQESHEEALAGLPSTEQVKELMLLYQLCIKLLGCGDPNRVVEIALDLLRKRTNAAVVGFLSVNDEGGLQPKLVIPARRGQSRDAEPIAHRAGFAAGPRRVGGQSGVEGAGTQDLGHFADAVCAPLVRRNVDGERTTLGRDSRLSRRRPLPPVGFRLHHLGGQHRGDRAGAGPRADHAAKRLPAAGGKVARPRRADRRLPADARPEIEDQPRRAVRRAACSCAAKAARARSSWRGRSIAPARGPIGRWSRSIAPRSRPTSWKASSSATRPARSPAPTATTSGFFQQADLGTLFLDEVGELTLEGQAKLLRILEGHPFLPVGATEEVSVDVRVIAATNQNLQKYVREKRFREDLYYRLSVFELHLPPLRDRGDDIGAAGRFFPRPFSPPARPAESGLTDAARGQAAGLPLARQRAAASQRARQRRRAGR